MKKAEKVEQELFGEIIEESSINSDNQVLTKNEIKLNDKKNKLLAELDSKKKEQVLALSEKLDFDNELTVKEFGNTLQQKLGQNSEQIIGRTKINNTDEAGVLLNDLMFELQSAGVEKKTTGVGFIDKFIKKMGKAKYDITTNYTTVSERVEGITQQLQIQNKQLADDIEIVNDLIENNQQLEVATDVYIKAGEIKAEELKTVIIPELKRQLSISKNPEIEQELMEKANYLDRLEKRVMDLQLTQQVLKQSYPQLSLMKNASYVLSEKIDSSIHHAIPTWKNQIAIAIGLKNQQTAVEVAKAVSETTNQLLRSNAEMLKTSVTETAKENERGIVDIETLEFTQNALIETIRETIEIQNKGRSDRESAKLRLEQMETEMKTKLMEMASSIAEENPNVRKTVYDSTEKLEYKKDSYEDLL